MRSYPRIGIAAWTVAAVGMWVQGLLAGPPQGGPGLGGFAPGRAVERLAQQLNLTDEQKNQVQSYLADQRSQMQVLRDNTSLTPEQRREQARAIGEQTRNSIRSLLNPDQQKKLDDLRGLARDRFSRRPGRGRRDGRGRGN